MTDDNEKTEADKEKITEEKKADSNPSQQPSSNKTSLKDLFPKKEKIVIGINDPKEYEIIPKLSFKKQVMEIPGLLEELFSAFNKYRNESIDLKLDKITKKSEGKDDSDETKNTEDAESKLVSDFLKIFRTNVFSILTLVIGVNQEIIEDASNDQLIYAIDIIFKENYETSGKNAIALWNRAKNILQSQKS